DDAGPGGAGPVGGMLAAPSENAIGYRLTDEGLAKVLSSEARASKLINEALASLPVQQAPAPKSRRHLAPLIPAGHGIAAVATFVLAVVSAFSARGARSRVRPGPWRVPGGCPRCSRNCSPPCTGRLTRRTRPRTGWPASPPGQRSAAATTPGGIDKSARRLSS